MPLHTARNAKYLLRNIYSLAHLLEGLPALCEAKHRWAAVFFLFIKNSVVNSEDCSSVADPGSGAFLTPGSGIRDG